MNMSAPGFAATPPGCFFGVWMINEQLTQRIRPQRGLMMFLAPWGDNGWVRVGGINGIDDPGIQRTEYHFVTWDDKVYPVFGSDPRHTRYKKIDDFTLESSSIRENRPERAGNSSITEFSEDCTRINWISTILDDRNDDPNKKDIRVYDKVEPYAAATSDIYFGAWKLNRQASTLMRSPMDEETVVFVPWGDNGWAHITISGSYQPEDFKGGLKPTRAERRPERNMYWATWDGTPAFNSGYDPAQVTVRKIGDYRFVTEFIRIHQPWQQGETGTIVFSNDGKRVTETRSGIGVDGIEFHNDIRVYDKIVPAEWPGEIRAPQ
ncbi:MAG: hypothetical protein O7E57_11425 [Gammaproteobacteria bacterium]|nr:hypothetical protein [Gammaproteobacteria bacterium]